MSTDSCLTVNVSQDCLEDISAFSLLYEKEFGDCPSLLEYNTTIVDLTAHSTCLPLNRTNPGDFCYRVVLQHQGNPIAVATNINSPTCSIRDLQSLLNDVNYELDSPEVNGTVVHLTTANLSCKSLMILAGDVEILRCLNGQWTPSGSVFCTCEFNLCY